MNTWPQRIDAAAGRIAPYVRCTPVIEVNTGIEGITEPVCLKLEQLQHTASFKPRGAFNRILSAQEKPERVVAASGGNHAIATAYAARALGIAADVFVPEISSPVKVKRVRALGATVHVGGRDYAEALRSSESFARAPGALVVHAYNQPEVIAGQGTVGRELEAQSPGLDTVLVAVGGGGLVGGISAWYAGRAKVVAVEPRTSAALHAAMQAGKPVDVEVAGIAADSLGARRVGEHNFAIAREHVAAHALVSDADIRAAQSWLWSELRLMCEPGGAAALAALASGAYRPAPGERIGIVLCGANVDPASVVA